MREGGEGSIPVCWAICPASALTFRHLATSRVEPPELNDPLRSRKPSKGEASARVVGDTARVVGEAARVAGEAARVAGEAARAAGKATRAAGEAATGARDG